MSTRVGFRKGLMTLMRSAILSRDAIISPLRLLPLGGHKEGRIFVQLKLTLDGYYIHLQLSPAQRTT